MIPFLLISILIVYFIMAIEYSYWMSNPSMDGRSVTCSNNPIALNISNRITWGEFSLYADMAFIIDFELVVFIAIHECLLCVLFIFIIN